MIAEVVSPAGLEPAIAIGRGRPPHEQLLEASWPGRDRSVGGSERARELAVTAGFLALAATLAVAAPAAGGMRVPFAAVVLAYAFAARVEFPIGNGSFVPTQVFLVAMFVVAPAQHVPLLVFTALVIAALVAAAQGAAGLDRLAFCGGDAIHSLGPALVLVLFAGGDATDAGALLILAAFAAQIVADLATSSLHELLTFRAPPQLHLRVMAEIWSVDAALGAVGLLAAAVAVQTPWAVLAPLPLVLVLAALAADRVRKIGAADERRMALDAERGRRQAVVGLLNRQIEFLQDVSHELRTPVTIARGHIDNVVRQERASPALMVSLTELERIDRIIERLLVLARAGEPAAFQPQCLDAETFLEDRFVRWSDTVPRPWQLGDLATGTLFADPDALDATLDALLENAVKHTGRSQLIGLSSRAEGGQLVIEVADGGSGIPEDALHRIFDRFARADSARNARVAGVGLGLAMVDAVAKAHGGRCSVESGPAGSTFTLRLPGFEPRDELSGFEPGDEEHRGARI